MNIKYPARIFHAGAALVNAAAVMLFAKNTRQQKQSMKQKKRSLTSYERRREF